jgi:hypothetical protein
MPVLPGTGRSLLNSQHFLPAGYPAELIGRTDQTAIECLGLALYIILRSVRQAATKHPIGGFSQIGIRTGDFSKPCQYSQLDDI